MSGGDSTQDMKASEELESKNAESLAKKFRLIPGEDIHMTKKPSTFAFVGMYALALRFYSCIYCLLELTICRVRIYC